jgi:hypothetical protein
MLMIAEGALSRPVTDQEHRMAAAWLVPMINAGFLHGGWIDTTEQRVWMVISATDLAEAQQRLDGLPFARDETASFTLTQVRALQSPDRAAGSYRLRAQHPITQQAASSTHPWREPLVSHSYPRTPRL